MKYVNVTWLWLLIMSWSVAGQVYGTSRVVRVIFVTVLYLSLFLRDVGCYSYGRVTVPSYLSKFVYSVTLPVEINTSRFTDELNGMCFVQLVKTLGFRPSLWYRFEQFSNAARLLPNHLTDCDIVTSEAKSKRKNSEEN